MRKRARMMRESKSIRSKWSSVPPNCRTHHSHHRGGASGPQRKRAPTRDWKYTPDQPRATKGRKR